mgnify:CR=1 FL=1
MRVLAYEPYPDQAFVSANGVELVDMDTLLAPVSYTHLRAHETVLDLVCRLLLEKKKIQSHQALKKENNMN